MHVAFLRNLNLGQPRSPSRAQLLEAFAAEGARDVLSHPSNGTVAFVRDGDLQAVAPGRHAARPRPMTYLIDVMAGGCPRDRGP